MFLILYMIRVKNWNETGYLMVHINRIITVKCEIISLAIIMFCVKNINDIWSCFKYYDYAPDLQKEFVRPTCRWIIAWVQLSCYFACQGAIWTWFIHRFLLYWTFGGVWMLTMPLLKSKSESNIFKIIAWLVDIDSILR